MKDRRFDNHFVAHDAFTLAFAVFAGALSAAIEGSLAFGVMAMGTVVALGVIVMRTTPLRRGVNRMASTLARAGVRK